MNTTKILIACVTIMVVAQPTFAKGKKDKEEEKPDLNIQPEEIVEQTPEERFRWIQDQLGEGGKGGGGGKPAEDKIKCKSPVTYKYKSGGGVVSHCGNF